MKPSRGRIPLKQTVARNTASLNFMAAASGKPAVSLDPPWLTEPKPRAPRGAVNARDEADIQAEIIEYLRARPDIGCPIRFNRGVMSEQGRMIRFSTVYEPHVWDDPDKLYPAVVDLQAMLKPTGRLIAIEVKKASFHGPKDKREKQQALYLRYVSEAGGIGIFATCLQSVIDALPPI